MTSTKVADNSLLFAKVANNLSDSYANKQTEGNSFSSVFSETAGKTGRTDSDTQEMKQSKTTVEKPGRKDLDTNRTSKTEQAKDKPDGKDFSENVSDAAEKVKDTVSEKLNVSEEDIEQAMETLGLSMIDLLNPQTLKELVMELSGKQDSMQLLTDAGLYRDMKEIIQVAAEAADQMMQEFDLNPEQFEKVMNSEELKSALDAMRQDEPVTDFSIKEVAKEPDTVQTDAVPKEEKEASFIHVEVVKSEEKTDNAEKPVQTSETTSSTKIVSDSMQTAGSNNENEAKDHGTNQDANAAFQMTQTTQTVNTVGEVVETVKQYTQSYVDGEQIVRQVTDHIKISINPDVTSMEMQLHPASLGTIHMNISSQNGVVTAQLLVQNEAVKAALESQMMTLQETFAEQGQKVEAVEVAVAGYDLNQGRQEFDGQKKEQNQSFMTKARRKINLQDLSTGELETLSEEDQLAAAVMDMNGNSVDYTV